MGDLDKAGDIALGVATLGISTQVQAGREQRRANRQARRIEQVKQRRQRVQAIRQQRIQSAQVQAQAASSGVQGSSPISGALAGLESQSNANAGFTNQINQLNLSRLRALDEAGRFQTLTGVIQSGTQLAMSAAGGA